MVTERFIVAPKVQYDPQGNPIWTENDMKEAAQKAAYDKDGNLTPESRQALMRRIHYSANLLSKKLDIFDLFIKQFDKKVIGEIDTKKALFLCMCGAFVQNLKLYPHAFVNSESSAGKSYITRQIFNIFPKSMREYRTRISPRVLDYWHNSKFEPEWSWDKKILYLEDIESKVLNSDTLKVLASEGSITTILVNQRAVDNEIKGKPIIIVTTAEAEPKTETLNRFCSITLDTSKEQTHQVNRFQAKLAMTSKLPDYDPEFTYFLSHLKRVKVQIPFIEKVVDLFPIDEIALRRVFPFFMSLIQCSAALHQYQRKQENGSIIAEGQDYDIARSVLFKVQPYSKMSSLTHRQKKAYEFCRLMTEENEIFKASEIIAKYPEFSDRMWKRHLQNLSSRGFLQTTHDENEGKGRPTIVYKANEMGQMELPKYENLD